MILCIYGSGGLGREVFDVAVRVNSKLNSWDEIIFVDDLEPEGHFFGTKRVKLSNLDIGLEKYEGIVAVGEPSSREKLFNNLTVKKIPLVTLVDPTAIISPSSKIGIGSIILENSLIKANTELHENVLIQPFCDIGHDTSIGSHSVMSPFSSPGGRTSFGKRVFFGMKASCLEQLTIGDDSIIGMGAVVFRDVPAGATVIGNPARVTKGNEQGKVFK